MKKLVFGQEPGEIAGMGKKRGVLLTGAVLLGVAVVAGVASLLLRGPAEPEYKGKPLGYWLRGYDVSRGNAQSTPAWADDAIEEMGTNAIPGLLKRLRAQDSPVIIKLVSLARKQHLVKINYVDAATLNRQGMEGFRALGSKAPPVIPELIKIYERYPGTSSQSDAAIILSWFGPASEPAIPALIRSAASTNLQEKRITVFVLGQIRVEPDLEVPVLIQALKDSDAEVRDYAAAALGNYGTNARVAIPALIDLFKADSANSSPVQLRATPTFSSNSTWNVLIPSGLGATEDALRRIDPAGADSAITQLLKDPDPAVRAEAINVLALGGVEYLHL